MNESKQESEKHVEPSKPRRWIMPGVVAAGALLGLVFALAMPDDWLFVPQQETVSDGHDHTGSGSKEFYACPMFCTRSDHGGPCPVCGMEMTKFVDTGARMPLDDQRRESIGLQTEPIQRRMLAREIRTLGEFQPDETRQKIVAAWVDGRIDKLYADFTGIPVEKGFHLFDLYSPSLYAAQKELIVARKAFNESSGSDVSKRMLDSAREKLRLLGLSSEQVAYIETLNEPNLTVTIPSPDAGIVTEKLAHVGMYVKQGQPVFRITDLTTLWLIVDVHERDLGLVALGQDVDIEVNAFPGRRFHGRVGFIDPSLDMKTRTVRVRVEVTNADLELKPGMFGTAAIFAELGKDGELAKPGLHGDYACPMHPLQRSTDPNAKCDICGMAMVLSPEEPGAKARKLWAIPREAVLQTGRRSMIYVEWWVREVEHPPHDADVAPPLEMIDEPQYQGFEVKLGPLAAEYHVMPDGTRHKLGEYYPLLGGLPTGMTMPNGEVGFRIVTSGQFLIDSQMELTGKPSLLRAEGGKAADPHAGHRKD
ncbi:MAG: efflux RND transporter periplasmic adaptor subunit [Planctomycetes bacterium]|nr:efflux RND transporter periplasmic adaptor subunit [Planctomycetota bacterium]